MIDSKQQAAAQAAFFFVPGQLASLWYQPCGPELSGTATGTFKLPADRFISIVRNMLVKESVGPEMKGFDPAGEPYKKFLRSIGKRKEIGFLTP